MRIMQYNFIKMIIAFFMLIFAFNAPAAAFTQAADSETETGQAGEINPVYVVEMEGTITAGQSNFLHRQMDKAREAEAQLFVLQLNTPGGLVDATLKMNELLLNAEIPVAVLVAPSGAIAGSAGAFILVSSDIAAMAPGSSVGAAQPIAMSPEGSEEAGEKTTKFYAAHLRSMARETGRPEDLAEKFVTENLTLDTREAYEEEMIEYVAYNLTDLLEQLDGTEIEKMGVTYEFNTEGAETIQDDMTLSERLQNWVSDPQIAFLLLMIGFMGIYMGLSAPGTIVPEVGGVILLILGIYGLGMFDNSTAGIVMILLGIGLIAAEIFSSGFGILGIGGAASLAAGAVLLPTEPLMAPDWYQTFLITVTGTVIGLVLIIIVVVQRIVQTRRQFQDGSAHFKPPERGVVTEEINPEGMIKTRGELWNARSDDNSTIPVGTEVEVVNAESLKLLVRAPGKDAKSS
ncbi:MAG: nodulation protein NfeD [Bacillota bacterium]